MRQRLHAQLWVAQPRLLPKRESEFDVTEVGGLAQTEHKKVCRHEDQSKEGGDRRLKSPITSPVEELLTFINKKLEDASTETDEVILEPPGNLDFQSNVV